jgi:hypothetical protein
MSYREFDHQVSTLDLAYIAGQIVNEETGGWLTEAHTLYAPKEGYSSFAVVIDEAVLMTATEEGNLVIWNLNEPHPYCGDGYDRDFYVVEDFIERMLKNKQDNCNIKPAPTWMREQLSNP